MVIAVVAAGASNQSLLTKKARHNYSKLKNFKALMKG
jgi:hypothetical protein